MTKKKLSLHCLDYTSPLAWVTLLRIPSRKWPMLIDFTHHDILFFATGVGRIIAEAKSTPTVIPFWHVGEWVLCCGLLCICALFHRNGWYASKLCTLYPTSFQGTYNVHLHIFRFDDNHFLLQRNGLSERLHVCIVLQGKRVDVYLFTLYIQANVVC